MDRCRRRYLAAPSCGDVNVKGAKLADAEEVIALLSTTKEVFRILKEAACEVVLKIFRDEDKIYIVEVKNKEKMNKIEVESKHDIPTLTNNSIEVRCEENSKDRMPVLGGEVGQFAASDMLTMAERDKNFRLYFFGLQKYKV